MSYRSRFQNWKPPWKQPDGNWRGGGLRWESDCTPERVPFLGYTAPYNPNDDGMEIFILRGVLPTRFTHWQPLPAPPAQQEGQCEWRWISFLAGPVARLWACIGLGFDVVGVDINPQPRYPFKFSQGDVKTLAIGSMDVDFIWASPPCQRHSRMSNCRKGLAAGYPDEIAFVRGMLKYHGKPYVIENVPGAPLINPSTLCGTMFELPLFRHRLFETSFPVTPPIHRSHSSKGGRAGHWNPGEIISVSGHCSPIELARKAMQIDWMNLLCDELCEAIPPAYSEFIASARQFVESLAPHTEKGESQ